MNNKALTLSIVMAVFAVFMVQSYVSSIEENAQKKFGTEVLVVTAKRDIKEAESINETMLELTLKPARFLEPSALSFAKKEADKETTKGMRSLIGTIAVVPIKKGEQLTFNKIVEPGIRTGLAPQISPGKRAFSIPVSDITGVSKLLKPGDRVDVIAIVDPGGGKDKKMSRTILQDTPVLAVGRSIANNAARTIEADAFAGGKERVRSLAEDYSFSSVTLELDPITAQTMALILASGDTVLNISLRNTDDNERMNLGVTTFPDLLSDQARGLASQRR